MDYDAAAVAQQTVVEREAVICPVRNMTEEQRRAVDRYVAAREAQGVIVHYPPRDTEQVDETGGLRICRDNIAGIRAADVVSVWWDPTSSGSKFDLGAAMALNKPVRLLNEVVLPDLPKSFEHVVVALNEEARL